MDPFERTVLITGGPSIREWLNLHLAERWGVVADFEEFYLDDFLWRDLARRAQGSGPLAGRHFRPLDPSMLQVMLMKFLQGRDLKALNSPPLEAALAPGGESLPGRRVQISARLAQLFLEYERNRPECFDRDSISAPLRSMTPGAEGWLMKTDAWQRSLWERVFSSEFSGLCPPDRDGTFHLTLPQLAILAEGKGDDRRDVCLFSIAKPSSFHRAQIARLAKEREVHVWQINPCSEFWEDVNTRGSRWASGPSALIPHLPPSPDPLAPNSAPLPPQDNQLLEWWGDQTRENVFLWCQNSHYDFEQLELSTGPREPSSLLSRLQNHLVVRSNQAERGIEPDTSLVMVEAPGRVREMEAIRDLIFHSCSPDPTHPMHLPHFKPEEALILVSDVEAYRAAIETVFRCHASWDAQGSMRVSLRLRAGSDCALGQALLSLMELIRGEFTRREVFSLLRNPAVWPTLGMDRESLSDFENLMVQMNVYRGMSVEQRGEFGDERPLEVHTWRHAFDRLRAGWIAEGWVWGRDQRELLCHAPPFMDPEVLARGMNKIEDLHSRVRELAQPQTAETFADRLRGFMEAFIQLPESSLQDSVLSMELKRQLTHLESFASREQEDAELYLAWLQGIVSSELGPDRGSRAGHLVVAPLRSAEVLPARLIVVAGLDGSFPGGHEHSAIDLMAEAPRMGDANPRAGLQEAMLSIVHASGERLVLSRCARDLEKERDLAPSCFWIELETHLKTSLLNQAEILRLGVPLLAREAPFHGAWSWEKTPVGGKVLNLMPTSMDDARLAALQTPVELPSPAMENHEKPEVVKIDISQVESFLRDPLAYGLSRQLGLREVTQSDEVLEDNDPLELDALTSWNQVDRALQGVVEGGGGRLEDVMRRDEARGHWPEPPLDRDEKTKLTSKTQALMLERERWLRGDGDPFNWVDPAGDRGPFSTGGVLELWVPMGERRQRVLVSHHRTLDLYRRGEDNLLLITNASGAKERGRYLLRLWLSTLWLRAMHQTSPALDLVHIGWNSKGHKAGVEKMKMATQSDGETFALNRLTHWIEEMLSPRDPSRALEHLPFEQIRELTCKQARGGRAWRSEDLQDAMEKDSGGYIPSLEAIALVDAQVPSSAPEIARERFRGFLPEQEQA